MDYSYISAYGLSGGHTSPGESPEVEIHASERMQVLLTKSVDRHCANIDRGLAISSLLLKGVFGSEEPREFDEALRLEIEHVRAERSKQIGQSLTLVIKLFGDTKVSMTEHKAEKDEFIVCFDAADKASIKEERREEIEAIISSLCMEADCKVQKLSEGVFFQDETNKVVYSYTASLGAVELFASRPLSQEKAREISRATQIALAETALAKVFRLHTQMVVQKDDRLRAFLRYRSR